MKRFLTVFLCFLVALGCVATASCKDKKQTEYTVCAPDGAPLMALTYMMKTNSDYDYSVISAADVAATFTRAETDFIIAPTNAGMKLAMAGGKYKIAATTSWGNLYIVGTQKVESENIDDIMGQFEGKEVYSIGSNQVPDLSFKKLLTEKGVNCTVTPSEASVIQAGLISGEIEYAILGEPAVTATLTRSAELKVVASISDLFKSVMGTEYPQASLFVKADLSQSAIEKFLTKLQESISYLNASEDNAYALGQYLESRGDSTLKGAIVKKCYLRMSQNFVRAIDCKQDIITFISVLGVNYNETQNAGVFYEKGV